MQHRLDSDLQLVELLGFGIGRRCDIGTRKGHQGFDEIAGVSGKAPDRAVRPLRAVVDGPKVEAHELGDRLDLLLCEAKPLEG